MLLSNEATAALEPIQAHLNSREAKLRWRSLPEKIKSISQSYSSQSNQLHFEIRIQLQYLLNLFSQSKNPLEKASDFLAAHTTLSQAMRYSDTLQELVYQFAQEGTQEIVSDLKEQLSRVISHCIAPVDQQIQQDQVHVKQYQQLTATLKYQHAHLMQDESACQLLNTTLSAISDLLIEPTSKTSCYISYAWPIAADKKHESWLQPFLCTVFEHLKMAGINPVLDIQHQESERVIEFATKAEQCDTVLLIGTPSLRAKHQDPYWRIDKILQSAQHQTVIPICLTGMPDESFVPEQALFSEIGDWRRLGYVGQLKTLIGQILSAKVDMQAYDACWAAFWKTCPQYTRAMPDLEGLDTAQLDLVYQDHMARLAQQSTYQHVKQQRGVDAIDLNTQAQEGDRGMRLRPAFSGRFQLPHPFADFTGRENPLKSLAAFTERGQTTVIGHGQQVSGTGGIGKTQLAVMFANRQLALHQLDASQGYATVIWFLAGSDDRQNSSGLLNMQFCELAQQLGIDIEYCHGPELYRRIYEVLKTREGKVLVVFDNAFEYDPLLTFLPNDPQFHTLITTRNSNVSQWSSSYSHLVLDVFELSDALHYIRKVLLRECPHYYNEKDATDLAEALGRFPLGLTQALAYITENDISISEYLSAFEEKKQRYYDLEPKDDPYKTEKNPECALYQKHRATVWTTLHLSMAAIHDLDAQNVLHTCAYLAADAPIDHALLAYSTQDEFKCDDALRALRSYGLLKDSSIENHVEIHAVVQDIVRMNDDEEALLKWFSEACYILTLPFEKDGAPLAVELQQNKLLPHLENVLALIRVSKVRARFQYAEAQLRVYLGMIYSDFGKYKESLRLYHLAKETLSQLGNQLPVVTSLLEKIGYTYYNLGDVLQAKACYEQVLAYRKRQYPEGHPCFAQSFLDLGNVFDFAGQTEIAGVLYQQALAITIENYGDQHHNVATALDHLGNICRVSGDPAQAIRLHQRAITIQEGIFGADHPDLARILTNLGSAYTDIHELTNAIKCHQRALAIKERHYGPSHIKVSITLVNLGNTYNLLEKPELAQPILERALEIQEAYYGVNHPDSAVTLTNLGSSHLKLEQPELSLEMFTRALQIKEQQYGRSHPQVSVTLTNLGNVQLVLGKLSLAKQIFERALRIQEQAFGSNHLRTTTTRFNLAHTLFELGLRDQAISAYRRCIHVFQHHFDESDPNIAYARSQIETLQQQAESIPHKLPCIKDIIESSDHLDDEILRKLIPNCYDEELYCIVTTIASSDIIDNIKDCEVFLAIVRSQITLGNLQAAAESIAKCTSLYPNNSDVEVLANQLAAMSDHSASWIVTSKEFIAKKPDTPSVIKCAIEGRQLGHFDIALRILNRVLMQEDQSSYHGPALFQVARCYYSKGHLEDAIEYCNRSLRIQHKETVQEFKLKLEFEITAVHHLDEILSSCSRLNK